jgi:tetratricopeptide (TPR) repeat protein
MQVFKKEDQKINHMKTKIKIIGLIVLMSSCNEDFLDLKPQTFVSSTTFFITENDYRQAVSGAYSSLRELYNNAYVMGEMRSDNTHYYLKASDRGQQNLEKEYISAFIDDPNNRYSAEKYFTCYQGISRCNAILDRIDKSSISEDVKAGLTGETKFLRAFYYFELVQYFGGVPLYLNEITDQAGTALPRASKEEVYAQIIADATAAANQLPTVQAEKGRATVGSAKTLLGYVYCTLKQYSEAEQALREVTTLGYILLPNYGDNFKTANKNSSESIFEVQYKEGTQQLQSSWTYQFIPSLLDTKVITGVSGNNQAIGGWNIPSDDLLAVYEPNDLRKAASIADGYTNSDGVFVPMPYTTKYLNPHAVFNNTDDNWIVYRYADVLLLLAETLNEQSKSSEALPFLNQVRERAGLASVTETNQGALRDIILKERRVELAFENHRWLDLVRTGKAIEVMTAYGDQMKQMFSYLLPRTYEVTEDKLLFPIPQSELVLNPDLVQNSGY